MLAAEYNISHVSLIRRFKRHEEQAAKERAAQRAAVKAADPARPETMPAPPAPRERQPGEPIPVGGYVDPHALQHEMSTEEWMRARGKSGFVMRTVEVDLGRYKGNLHDDSDARAVAMAERARLQREDDDFRAEHGWFDPSSGQTRFD